MDLCRGFKIKSYEEAVAFAALLDNLPNLEILFYNIEEEYEQIIAQRHPNLELKSKRWMLFRQQS